MRLLVAQKQKHSFFLAHIFFLWSGAMGPGPLLGTIPYPQFFLENETPLTYKTLAGYHSAPHGASQEARDKEIRCQRPSRS